MPLSRPSARAAETNAMRSLHASCTVVPCARRRHAERRSAGMGRPSPRSPVRRTGTKALQRLHATSPVRHGRKRARAARASSEGACAGVPLMNEQAERDRRVRAQKRIGGEGDGRSGAAGAHACKDGVRRMRFLPSHARARRCAARTPRIDARGRCGVQPVHAEVEAGARFRRAPIPRTAFYCGTTCAGSARRSAERVRARGHRRARRPWRSSRAQTARPLAFFADRRERRNDGHAARDPQGASCRMVRRWRPLGDDQADDRGGAASLPRQERSDFFMTD